MLPRIFDVLRAGPRAIDRSEGGLGIGLALVRSLVALHGGSVSVSSDGLGRQRVRGAAAARAVREMASASDGIEAPMRRRAQRYVRAPRRRQSRRAGAALRGGAHPGLRGADGARRPDRAGRARTFTPNVIVLDIGLPVMDGYEVARHLRGLPVWSQSPWSR